MAKVYFNQAELDSFKRDERGVLPAAAYALRSPMPQMFMVTVDPELKSIGPSIRTVTMTPLSWGPYTKAVSIPLDDDNVVRNLSAAGAECVLGEPTRLQLRELTICAQRLPRGVSEAEVARFRMCRSLFVDVPSIDDCPVNLECVVEHLERYHTHLVAFLRVVGASIDDSMLFREREEIVSLFPTNYADEVVDAHGAVRRRVSLLKHLYLCPTFPLAPKQGWYAVFDVWVKDLASEGLLQPNERDQICAWFARWQEVFSDLNSPERRRLRARLTEAIRLIVEERWARLRLFLADERE